MKPVKYKYPKHFILKWRMRGWTPRKIAKRLGAKPRYIEEKLRQWKKKENLIYPKIEVKTFSNEDVRKAVSLYSKGLTLAKIGKKLSSSPETIRVHLLRYGVDPRLPKITKIKCKRGHDITRESGNRLSGKSGNISCLECREFRKLGLHLKKICDKGHKIEGKNAYHNYGSRGARCMICWREYLRNRHRKMKKLPKKKWRVA